jgi:hypothetical protein
LNAGQENLPPRATVSVSLVLLEKNKLVLHAKIVEQVNSALVTQIPLVPIARKVLIKRKKANLIVCRVFLEHLKMTRAQKLVKFVAKDNIKINPVMKPVWIAKWVGT